MKCLLQIILFILLTNLNFAQWKKINLPDTWGTAWSLDACDSNCVIVATSPYVFFTEDIGETWTNITPFADTGNDIIDISIISPNAIWGTTGNGEIIFSADKGLTWQIQFSDTSKTEFLNYIEMFDINNGMAMGDSPTLSEKALFLRTSDGGKNWIEMENNQNIYASGDIWRRVDFVSPDIGFFTENWSGKENQGVKRTIDGGNNWEVVFSDMSVQVLKFYNSDIGLAYIDNILRRTDDGGNSWKEFEYNFGGWGNDIEFLPNDPSQVWITTGSNGIFFSSDTGATWEKIEVTTTNEYFKGRDIVFTDNQNGWYLSDGGDLFYTNNNGGLLTNIEKSESVVKPTNFVLEQNYPNPFNPETTIKYTVPNVETGYIPSLRMTVYDILGNEITVLVNEHKSPGTYEIKFDGSNYSSGVYYYQLKIGNNIVIKKMVLLK